MAAALFVQGWEFQSTQQENVCALNEECSHQIFQLGNCCFPTCQSDSDGAQVYHGHLFNTILDVNGKYNSTRIYSTQTIVVVGSTLYGLKIQVLLTISLLFVQFFNLHKIPDATIFESESMGLFFESS